VHDERERKGGNAAAAAPVSPSTVCCGSRRSVRPSASAALSARMSAAAWLFIISRNSPVPYVVFEALGSRQSSGELDHRGFDRPVSRKTCRSTV
jgi:hypothetical protein